MLRSLQGAHGASNPVRKPCPQTLCLQVMLGVDRLDMIKGIPQKLLAFEKFLEENPEWRGKVLLVQIAVPSRTDVPEYQARALSGTDDCQSLQQTTS